MSVVTRLSVINEFFVVAVVLQLLARARLKMAVRSRMHKGYRLPAMCNSDTRIAGFYCSKGHVFPTLPRQKYRSFAISSRRRSVDRSSNPNANPRHIYLSEVAFAFAFANAFLLFAFLYRKKEQEKNKEHLPNKQQISSYI